MPLVGVLKDLKHKKRFQNALNFKLNNTLAGFSKILNFNNGIFENLQIAMLFQKIKLNQIKLKFFKN